VLTGLEAVALPVIVIDDGSPAACLAALEAELARCPWATLVRLPLNSGKGGAMMAGLRVARERGYTHAVQIDADGQHRVADVPAMLKIAAHDPTALVSGTPVFDATVPGSRRHGRKVSLFWSRLATLSTDIEDAMCGFRVYPLEAMARVLAAQLPGRGMEFDAEILVRAHWAGIPLRFMPTPVIYPVGGRSHFRLVRDNVRISLMHTRLILEMLPRLPRLIARRQRRVPGRERSS
jgi:glycosyltransferase involved in cell wall biosynthesis